MSGWDSLVLEQSTQLISSAELKGMSSAYSQMESACTTASSQYRWDDQSAPARQNSELTSGDSDTLQNFAVGVSEGLRFQCEEKSHDRKSLKDQ